MKAGTEDDVWPMTVTEYLKLFGEDSIIRLMRGEIESAIESMPDDRSKRAMLSQLVSEYDALLKEDILKTVRSSNEVTAYRKIQDVIRAYCGLFEDIIAPIFSKYDEGFNIGDIQNNATIFGNTQVGLKYDP